MALAASRRSVTRGSSPETDIAVAGFDDLEAAALAHPR